MESINTTIESMGKLSDMDILCIDKGFTCGNYANAYETENYDLAVSRISGSNGFYRIGFLLGFFSSYESHEVDDLVALDLNHYRAVISKLDIGIAV